MDISSITNNLKAIVILAGKNQLGLSAFIMNKKTIPYVLCFLLLAATMLASCINEKKGSGEEAVVSDSISIGDMFTFYELPYAYDHSIIYNKKDRKWHLYGIEAGNKTFIHLTADSLTQREWEKREPFSYKGLEIWAPHIIEHQDLYYMYYTCIGVPREIRLAVSEDLNSWSYPSEDPIFALMNEHTDNMKNKDPMVFKHQDKWVMYYSMMKDDKHWVVGYSTSTDLLNWSEPGICFDEHTEEPGVESPFVVKRGKYFYLFLSARPWPHGAEEIFRSEDPFLWESKDLVKSINPWHAAELVQDLDGKWYITRSSGKQSDFRMAPLYWND